MEQRSSTCDRLLTTS